MATQIKDVREDISDIAIMAKVLRSLPSRYNALQTAWDSVPEENQSLDNLLERLLKEEERLEGDEDTTERKGETEKKKRTREKCAIAHSL